VKAAKQASAKEADARAGQRLRKTVSSPPSQAQSSGRRGAWTRVTLGGFELEATWSRHGRFVRSDSLKRSKAYLCHSVSQPVGLKCAQGPLDEGEEPGSSSSPPHLHRPLPRPHSDPSNCA